MQVTLTHINGKKIRRKWMLQKITILNELENILQYSPIKTLLALSQDDPWTRLVNETLNTVRTTIVLMEASGQL